MPSTAHQNRFIGDHPRGLQASYRAIAPWVLSPTAALSLAGWRLLKGAGDFGDAGM
ncbi:MAG: hypothetical protein O3C67_04835 [Cyanobacteria bacterium]|nr:hypothetical protein [Cyanobacteriota bacterium]